MLYQNVIYSVFKACYPIFLDKKVIQIQIFKIFNYDSLRLYF